MLFLQTVVRNWILLTVTACCGALANPAGEATHRYGNGAAFRYPGTWTAEESYPNVRLFPEGKKDGGLYVVTHGAGVTNPADPRIDAFFERALAAAGFRKVAGSETRIRKGPAVDVRSWKVASAKTGMEATAWQGAAILAGEQALALLAFDETPVMAARQNVLLGILGSMTAPAAQQQRETSQSYRIWRLGREITHAAVLAALEKSPKEQLDRANELARGLQVQIPAMPPFEGSGSKRISDATYYLLRTAGSTISSDLIARHGSESGAVFELGLKSMMLVLHYDPRDSAGQSIAEAMQRASRQAGLPVDLTKELFDAIEGKKERRVVIDLTINLDDRMREHFLSR